MKGLAVVLFFGLCGLAYCRPEEKYTTKYDNVNLDDIIRNDRLMKNYLDCVLEKRKCTKDGEELKSKLIYDFFIIQFFLCIYKIT